MISPCVDASVALAVLLPDEELSRSSSRLWRSWTKEGVEPAVPPLFEAEVTSGLRHAAHRGRMTEVAADAAFVLFQQLRVRHLAPVDLQRRAWELARAHRQSRTYDAQYLALAESLGADLWTADRRLSATVPLPWVRWVGVERSGS